MLAVAHDGYVRGKIVHESGGGCAASLSAHGNGDEDEEGQIEDAKGGDEEAHALPVETAEEARRQDGDGEDRREGVGWILRGHALIDENRAERPDEQEERVLFREGAAKGSSPLLPDFFCRTPDERQGPWEETREEKKDVVIPDILSGMFGDGRAQEIVRAEERPEEVCAVQAVHGVVPTASNEQEEDHAAAPAKAKKLLRILSEHEVNGKQESRQEETDRPFREDGESCKEEGGVVAHTFS